METQAVPEIPSELSGPVPRKVRLSESSRLLPFLLAALIGALTLGGFLYCMHVARQMHQKSALRQDGVEVQGAITSLKRADRGPDVVQYTFTANGQNISGQADVPPELMQNLENSSSLAVRYLPSNPAINHPAAWEWSLSSEWLLIFMLLGILAVCIVTARAAGGGRELLVWGTPAAGLVIHCAPTRSAYLVQYEFRTEAGAHVTGSGESLDSQDAGARIWVLYLPQNPRRNRPYPLSDYCVDE
jgi:hypothetical protein